MLRTICILAIGVASIPTVDGMSNQLPIGVFAEDVNSMEFYVGPVRSSGEAPVQPVPLDIDASILPGTLAITGGAGGTRVGVCAGLTPSLDTHLTHFDLATGKTLNQTVIDHYVVEAIISDSSTGKTFVAAFKQNDRTAERGGPSGGTNHIYELSHGDITSVAVLSNVTVEMGSAALCESASILFLTARDDDTDSGVSLVRVDLATGAVLTNVALEDDTNIIMWNEDNKTLMAWTENEAGIGELITVNVLTGKRVSLIASLPGMTPNGMSGAASAYDHATKTVFGVLINQTTSPTHPDGIPTTVAVDVTTGAYRTKQSKYFAMDMVAL